MDYSRPGFPIHHRFPEPAQTHIHRVGDAIQPSHPLSPPFPSAFNPLLLLPLLYKREQFHIDAWGVQFCGRPSRFQETSLSEKASGNCYCCSVTLALLITQKAEQLDRNLWLPNQAISPTHENTRHCCQYIVASPFHCMLIYYWIQMHWWQMNSVCKPYHNHIKEF